MRSKEVENRLKRLRVQEPAEALDERVKATLGMTRDSAATTEGVWRGEHPREIGRWKIILGGCYAAAAALLIVGVGLWSASRIEVMHVPIDSPGNEWVVLNLPDQSRLEIAPGTKNLEHPLYHDIKSAGLLAGMKEDLAVLVTLLLAVVCKIVNRLSIDSRKKRGGS